MKKLVVLFSIFLLAITLSAPFSVSAETKAGVKPGSFWYGFDMLGEKINLFFTFNSEKKAKIALEYADERLAEIEESAGDNKSEAVAKAMENYQENVSLATAEAKTLKDETKTETLLSTIASSTSKHQEILAGVLEKVPEEAKDAIRNAILASKKETEEVTKQISSLKKENTELKNKIEELKNELEKKEEEKNEKKSETKPGVKSEKKSGEKEIEKLKQQETKNTSNNSSIEIENLKKEIQEIKAVQETLKPLPLTRRINISQSAYSYNDVLKTNMSNRVLSANVISEGNSPVSLSDITICMEGTAPHTVIDYLYLEQNPEIHYSFNSDGCTIINNKSFSLQPQGIGGSSTNIIVYVFLAKEISSADNGKTLIFTLKSVVSDGEILGRLPVTGYTYKVPPPSPQPLPKVSAIPGQSDLKNTFSAIKITSDKKVFLNSIKWSMPGSGSLSNFENLKTYIDGVSYDGVSSVDGKYFTSNFNGVIMNPNETKEISIRGDIVGLYVGHWLSLDVYKSTDLNITDENGKAITSQAEQLWNYENSGGFRSINPWYDGYKIEGN